MPVAGIPEELRPAVDGQRQGSTGSVLSNPPHNLHPHHQQQQQDRHQDQLFPDTIRGSRYSVMERDERGGIGGADEEFFQDENYVDDDGDVVSSTAGVWQTTGDPSLAGSVAGMLKDPMIQLFGIVFILFLLTAILATINFCIWYLERRRRRVPLHWRSSPGVDVVGSRPVSQTPKRSFHIQHALYKTVRRPSAMPP